MSAVQIKKATSLRLDQKLYQYIEKLAKKDNRSVNNFIETVLAEATNFYEPNKETQRAMEQVKKGKNLKRYKGSKDVFEDLGV